MLAVPRAMTPSGRWVISYKLLGTQEWFVVRHTDCGMLLFTSDDMRNPLASSLKTATLDQSGWHDSGEGPGSAEGNYINRPTFSDIRKTHGSSRSQYGW